MISFSHVLALGKKDTSILEVRSGGDLGIIFHCTEVAFVQSSWRRRMGKRSNGTTSNQSTQTLYGNNYGRAVLKTRLMQDVMLWFVFRGLYLEEDDRTTAKIFGAEIWPRTLFYSEAQLDRLPSTQFLRLLTKF